MTKIRKHLYSYEAEALGLLPKENMIGRNQARYYIEKEDWKKIKKDREEGILKAHQEHKVDPSHSKFLWLKNKNSSIPVQNPFYVSKLEKTYFDLRDEIIKDLKKYTPNFPKLEREEIQTPHLLVIDPADIHIGKLSDSFETGEEYSSQIAVKRVLQGVKGILSKASGFNFDKILFVGGNDILHIDTPKRTTTSGTPQDTDGMWYTNFLIAKRLYVDLLELLLTVADVHFVFNPSNHDFTNGFFLADVVQTYFKDCKNITFDCSLEHRKYYKYGNNLIGPTHGDGAKMMDLPLLMAQECKEWSSTIHRYIYVHHLHHKWSKDVIGVTIEGLRSPSGADGWHHRNGYQHAPKAVEGFIHCKKNGQIARLTHIF